MGDERWVAVESALRALAHRDLSSRELEERLEAKGFAHSEREQALETLRGSGLVDDRRFAEGRARSLAARGAGNAAIRHVLRRAGVEARLVVGALKALAPENDRARDLVERRGASPKTARYLRSKGFSEEAIASAVAAVSGEELG